MAVTDILNREALERLKRPTGRALGLPREAFFDPAWHEAEMERVFRRQWVAVGVASQMRKPGSAHPVTVGGAPIVVTCTDKGELRAFHNICAHRGVLLATHACEGLKLLRCPYHSWSYDLTGRLVATPHFGGHHQHEHPDLVKSENGLKEVRLGVWADLVFVNLSAEGQSLEDFLAPLVARWKDYDFSLLRYGGTKTFEVAANWKLAIENFSESYHLPFVHPRLNGSSPMEDHYCFTAEGVGSGQGSRAYVTGSVDGRTLPTFPGLDAEGMKRAEYPVLFPNFMSGVHPEYFFALMVYPTSPTTCHEELHVFFVGDEAMKPEYAANRANVVDLWTVTNLEDMDVVTRMQVGRGSPAMEGGRFSPELDTCVHDFQIQLADAMLADEPRPRPVSRAAE
ncbi:aromatic ring-hydroxylating oxygenase subunit alpha [Zavarzinia sp. CC-PAN008]|uniref:aromatic ring-hydroxylating oxygenase subunit alpha n=1 Tax=Zavarzinia sp. CC-PAN008 TaxID=3243332 RepID=UPI003F749A28